MWVILKDYYLDREILDWRVRTSKILIDTAVLSSKKGFIYSFANSI